MFFIAKFNGVDMMVSGELLESGKITLVIDKYYEISKVAEAFRYLGEGHARGKIILTW